MLICAISFYLWWQVLFLATRYVACVTFEVPSVTEKEQYGCFHSVYMSHFHKKSRMVRFNILLVIGLTRKPTNLCTQPYSMLSLCTTPHPTVIQDNVHKLVIYHVGNTSHKLGVWFYCVGYTYQANWIFVGISSVLCLYISYAGGLVLLANSTSNQFLPSTNKIPSALCQFCHCYMGCIFIIYESCVWVKEIKLMCQDISKFYFCTDTIVFQSLNKKHDKPCLSLSDKELLIHH